MARVFDLGSSLESIKFFVAKVYAYVFQDVRGKCDSEGEWDPLFNEGSDGYDTIEWIAKQSWCNGKIGTMGLSYMGWVQWAAAREKPPHLVTMAPTASVGYIMKGFPYFNGIPILTWLAWLQIAGGRTFYHDLTSAADWEKVFYHLPLYTMDEVMDRTNTVWREWMAHPNLDEFWKRILFTAEHFQGINLPVLHITGWYDGDQPGALFMYEGMVSHSPAAEQQYLIIGPWGHIGTRWPRQNLGGMDFTPAALIDMDKVHLKWFDYWLKGIKNDVPTWKRTKYFVMGVNKWVEEDITWPPPDNAYLRYYLHSDGKANTFMGDGTLSLDDPGVEPPDTYIYNPEDPVVEVMDLNLYGTQVETPLDNRFILRRDDVLVYTRKPLEKEVLITGRPIVELYASSNCLDTDWFATLADVYPDGRSIFLGIGGLRARYRNSLETPELLVPGQVYKFTIELDSTCVLFQPGHKIRLTITSSSFPNCARNQNTGNNIVEDTEIKIATNMIYHDKNYPSSLVLPAKS